MRALKSWWANLTPTWRMAIKQFVSALCAVVITNVTDPQSMAFSAAWFRHLGVAMFWLTLVNEARYWQDWANTPEGDK